MASLIASRARIVTAGDEARRRIERDLHDGAQQRLVALALRVRLLQASPPTDSDLRQQLADVGDGLAEACEELRQVSHGIHPAVLSHGGLRPALGALRRRAAIPVELRVDVERRLPESVEVAAYYVVAEALTNAAKHACASQVTVDVNADDKLLRLSVTDDGVGGLSRAAVLDCSGSRTEWRHWAATSTSPAAITRAPHLPPRFHAALCDSPLSHRDASS